MNKEHQSEDSSDKSKKDIEEGSLIKLFVLKTIETILSNQDIIIKSVDKLNNKIDKLLEQKN